MMLINDALMLYEKSVIFEVLKKTVYGSKENK